MPPTVPAPGASFHTTRLTARFTPTLAQKWEGGHGAAIRLARTVRAEAGAATDRRGLRAGGNGQPGRSRNHNHHHRDQDSSAEHTSELQSLMFTTYAVICLNKTTSTAANRAYTL